MFKDIYVCGETNERRKPPVLSHSNAAECLRKREIVKKKTKKKNAIQSDL